MSARSDTTQAENTPRLRPKKTVEFIYDRIDHVGKIRNAIGNPARLIHRGKIILMRFIMRAAAAGIFLQHDRNFWLGHFSP